ncbi:MAG: M56 family metallopeptidase [bacterium]|nr:M56 family metallopeptidase [bacterium]
MPPSLEPLTAWLVTFLLHSTLLLGAVWIAARWIRTPAVRDVLWKSTLVGALLTTSLHGRIGIATTDIPLLAPPDGVAAGVLGLGLDGVQGVEGTREAGRAATRGQDVPAAALDVGAVVTWSWIAVSVILLATLAGAHGRRARLFRTRRGLARGPLLAVLRTLAREMTPATRVRLSESDAIGSPVALGRSEVCVPSRAGTEMTPGEQQAMLAHELAHIARRDPAWLLFAHVLERVFFFQPLVRVVRKCMQEDAEYVCDELATRHIDEPVDLARSLARVAEWIGPKRSTELVPAMVTRTSGLVARVERIVQAGDGTRARSTRSAMGAMLVATGILACAGPGVRGSGDGAPAPEESEVEIAAMISDSGETPASVPRQAPRTYEVRILADGSIEADGQVLAGEHGARAWLQSLAQGMRRRPLRADSEGPGVPDDSLLIRADRATSFRDIKKLMELCGRQSIQIWKTEFAEEGQPPMRVWMPVDLGVGENAIFEPVEEEEIIEEGSGEVQPTARHKVDLLVRLREPGKAWNDPARVLQYSIGDKRFTDLHDLERHLARMLERKELERLPLVLDIRPGIVYGEVKRLLDATIRSGWTNIQFVGAYH